jgi:ketosteroid isomerase-like protein
MAYRPVVVALVALSGCAVPVVQVNPMHPKPRPLWPHGVETLQLYKSRPAGGVAVYSLEASGEDEPDVEQAVKEKAASLGCDGILYTVRLDQQVSEGTALTGKLTAAHEYVSARVDALCVVVPASIVESCVASTKLDPSAPPVEVDRAVRDALEAWRAAYEARSAEAAAKLYVHDASLNVSQDGSSLLGWTEFEPVLRERFAGVARVTIGEVQVTATGGAAVVVAGLQRERSVAGATVTDDGVVTLVLRLSVVNEVAGWLIAAEHVSFQRR